MLDETGVVALVERIGFSTSSIKFQREATEAIESLVAGDRLGIIHGTFQHALASDADIIVRHIRLVHISGVAGDSVLTDALDAQRALVEEGDRTHTSGQIRSLLEGGYALRVYVSAHSEHITDPKEQIGASMTRLRRLLDRR
jgi:2-keto-myo-inositol isomerase